MRRISTTPRLDTSPATHWLHPTPLTIVQGTSITRHYQKIDHLHTTTAIVRTNVSVRSRNVPGYAVHTDRLPVYAGGLTTGARMHYAPTSTTANTTSDPAAVPAPDPPLVRGGRQGRGQRQRLGRAGARLDGPDRSAPAGAAIDWAAILPPPGFRGVLPRRWVGKRIFAWLGQNRRLSKDFERPCATGEALIYAAMARLMLRDLARA